MKKWIVKLYNIFFEKPEETIKVMTILSIITTIMSFRIHFEYPISILCFLPLANLPWIFGIIILLMGRQFKKKV